MYASTEGEKSFSRVFFFRRRFVSVRLGRTAGERRPTKSSVRKRRCAREFFNSVTNNACKFFLFRPLLGNYKTFVSLGVAAGDFQFFSVRNRERVQKTKFSPSVSANVCKHGFSSLARAKIGISRVGVGVRTRGTKLCVLDGRASPPSLSRRGGLLFALAVAGSTFLRKPEIANSIFCSSVTGEKT